MSVNFQLTPAGAAASNVFVEQQNIRRGVGATFQRRILIFGQFNSGFSPTVDEPLLMQSVADAQARYGRGSHLALSVAAAFRAGALGYEIYAVPLTEAGAAVAASGTIAVTGTATAAGTLALTVAGVEVDVAVASGDAATAVGDAIEAAINAKADLPVTAANVTGTVTVTAKNKGTIGNQIKMAINQSADDATPAGLTMTVASSLSSGATDPTLTTALSNFQDTSVWYSEVVWPYQGDTEISSLEAVLDERQKPGVKRPVVAFIGYTDTRSNLLTALGTAGSRTRNNEWVSYIPVHGSLTPDFEISAAGAGVYAALQSANVGRPVIYNRIPGVRAATANDLTYSNRDSGVKLGASYTINSGSAVLFGDLVSTRIETDAGVATDAYRFVTDFVPGLQIKINDLEITYGSAPFRAATVIDNDAPGGIANAVRPNDAIAYARQLVERWVGLGITKNRDAVISGITAEINGTNAGRIDVSIPDDFALGLRIMAALIEWDS